MRRHPLTPPRRAFLAAATSLISVITTVAISAAVAQGDDSTRILALPGEAERVRVTGDGTYQISGDDGWTWSRPLPQPTLIHLRSRTFDPVATVASPDPSAAYLIQFRTAPLDSQRRDLRRHGVRLGAYIPDAAYVARMTPAVRDIVAGKPYVRWVGAYRPADKVLPGVRPGRVIITLVEQDLVDQGAVINKIEQIGGTVQLVSASRATTHATLDSAQMRLIAANGAVLAIEQWTAPGTDMNLAREDGGASLIETERGYRVRVCGGRSWMPGCAPRTRSSQCARRSCTPAPPQTSATGRWSME